MLSSNLIAIFVGGSGAALFAACNGTVHKLSPSIIALVQFIGIFVIIIITFIVIVISMIGCSLQTYLPFSSGGPAQRCSPTITVQCTNSARA